MLIAIPHWRAPTWERSRDYRDSLARAGAGWLRVDGDRLPGEAGGLLLTGGVDVDPRLYGEARRASTNRPHRRRDAQELSLLRQALVRDIPVLAVCRGHQLLNVVFGGKLLQHIEGDGHRATGEGDSRWHEVRLEPGSRLAEALYLPVMPVNSRHHQAVTADRLGRGLKPAAHSHDGLIEAVESLEHRWVVGVQWHPERPEMRPGSAILFTAFVQACVSGGH